MKTSNNGVEVVKHFEGFRGTPYLCQAKKWTIGYGHTEGVTENTPYITEAQARDMLAFDLIRFENSVNRLIAVPLKQCQFDALVSFTYNLGGGVLQRSTLRQKLNRKEYNGAANEFLKWVYAGGVKRKGLAYRRKAERALFLSI